MMTCDMIRPLLNAWIDRELTVDESKQVETHLNACDACRQEHESLVELDQLLSSSLLVNDVDRKIATIMQRLESTTELAKNERHRWKWVSLVVAVAATLLLALLPAMLDGLKTRGVPVARPVVVARMVRATGPVQLLSPGARDWTSVSPGSSESFVAGSRFKTSDTVLCEFQTSADGVIRLNVSAELVIHQPHQIELLAGQLWCLAPASNGIDVDIPVSNVETPRMATLACPSSSEFQCMAGNEFALCNSVSPENANARMTLGAFTCPLAPGETVSVDANQNVDRTASDDAASKVWQLPLLAIGTSVDQELVSLLNSLLAPIGRTKVRSLNEEQILRLGPPGAIPLLAYVIAESSPEYLEMRRTATRLASTIADERGAGMLMTLTSDPDGYIANQAKESLNRILAEPKQTQ